MPDGLAAEILIDGDDDGLVAVLLQNVPGEGAEGGLFQVGEGHIAHVAGERLDDAGLLGGLGGSSGLAVGRFGRGGRFKACGNHGAVCLVKREDRGGIVRIGPAGVEQLVHVALDRRGGQRGIAVAVDGEGSLGPDVLTDRVVAVEAVCAVGVQRQGEVVVLAAEVALFAVGVDAGKVGGIGGGHGGEGPVLIDLEDRGGIAHIADPVDQQTVHIALDGSGGEGDDAVGGGPGALEEDLLAHAVGLVKAVAAVGVQRKDELAHTVAELGRLAVGVAAGERGIEAAFLAADRSGGLLKLRLTGIGEGRGGLSLFTVIEVGNVGGVDVAGEGVGDRIDVGVAERVVDDRLDVLVVVGLVGLRRLNEVIQFVVADEVQRPFVRAVLAGVGLAERQAPGADQRRAAHFKDHQVEVGGIGGLDRPDAVVDAAHMAGDADGEELGHDGLGRVLLDLAGLADDVQILTGVIGLGEIFLGQINVCDVGVVGLVLPFHVEVVEALVAQRLHRDVAGAHELGDRFVVQRIEDGQAQVLITREDAGGIHVRLEEEVAARHMGVVHDVLVGILLFELIDGGLLGDVVAEVHLALLQGDLGGGGLGDDFIGDHLDVGLVQVHAAGDVLSGIGRPVLGVGPQREVVAGHEVHDQIVAGADGLGGEIVAGVLRIEDVGAGQRELKVVRGLGRSIPVDAEGVGVNGFPALDVLKLQRFARADEPVEGGGAVLGGDGVAIGVGDGLEQEDVPVGAVGRALIALGQIGVELLVLVEVEEALVNVPVELVLRSARAGRRLEVLDVHAGSDGQIPVEAADFAVLGGILVIVVARAVCRSAAACAEAQCHDDREDQRYCLFHFVLPFLFRIYCEFSTKRRRGETSLDCHFSVLSKGKQFIFCSTYSLSENKTRSDGRYWGARAPERRAGEPFFPQVGAFFVFFLSPHADLESKCRIGKRIARAFFACYPFAEKTNRRTLPCLPYPDAPPP